MTSHEELHWKERIRQPDDRLLNDRCLMHLVLYDGRCPLCNGIVRFLLRCDRQGKLMFAPLQGETARSLASLWEQRDETIILVSYVGTDRERVCEKSDAVLEIFRLLNSVWKALTILAVIPRAVRDRVYDWVARNRFRWFGSPAYEECPLPPPEYRARFLP
jgi:predicted DCC family thiol-disulfide oxidoreductase YuxK